MQEKPHVAATAEVREALLELQRYLSDTIAPLMVADSIELLARAPAELTAAQIHAWSTSQYKGLGASVPVSDYLFHAMKKIHLTGEYDLVSRESLIRFLHELARHLLAYCPPEDRELLRTNIGRLGEATTILSSPVEFLHRQAGSGAQPLASAQPVALGGTAPLASQGVAGGGAGATVPLTPDLARGLRGFGLLLERLERTTGRGEAEGREILSQLLTMAAVNSHSEPELEQHLEQLRDLGLERRPRDLFRDLSRSLPDWNVPQVSGGDDALPMNPLGPIEAMHNLIALAEDPNEGALRFREMVQAAIEQFNEGSLGRAATMLELAERIIVEKKVDYTAVESVRKTSAELLNGEMLRQFAENSEKHPALRKVMNFFSALKPKGLLHELRLEEKREKRRLGLALLEAHGAAAHREAEVCLREVTSDPANDPNRFFTRNLVYLLRRIPVPDGVESGEVEIIAALLVPTAPIYLLKETIAYLGQAKSETAERALIAFLGDIEMILTGGKDSPFDPQDMRQLLDRTVSALARFGGPNSTPAVLAHGLKRIPELGDTGARLTDLGARDLSGEPEIVEKLLKWLRSELPMRILGFVVQRATVNVFHLIDALAGTETAAVRSTFEEIAQRYPNEDFGKAAAAALTGFGATPKASDTTPSIALSGDLEIFGLPNLLQTLAESNVSGVLTLKDTESDVVGMIAFEQGRIQEAHAGKLRGPEAVYQMFERPKAGTFAFANRSTPAPKDRTGALLEVVPVLFEAMKRYDEFRQARLLVPDETTFEISGIRPSSPPDERDGSLARAVWSKVRSGANALECESDVGADPYRVRRLLVHWVDQGALQQI